MLTVAPAPTAEQRGYQAVETLYHAYLTGTVLAAVAHRGPEDAALLVFSLFRRQQEEKFLPGLEKLGLQGLPDAVASAQYHYLSNSLGGVKVEYMFETDKKAWVRYLPPRWIFEGSAICGIPSQVSRAMLRAWHAHNGVGLDNPRLGFVCTQQTVDGQPALEGYFQEYEHMLAPEERLRFAPGEEGPPFNPAAAPELPQQDWPPERMRKAMRNYTMDYISTLLMETVATFGPAEGGWLASHAARLTGMQHYEVTAALVGGQNGNPGAGEEVQPTAAPGEEPRNGFAENAPPAPGRQPQPASGAGPQTAAGGLPAGAAGFAQYLTAMGRAQGDDTHWESEGEGTLVRQSEWRLMRGRENVPPAAFEAWNALWQGALSVHDRGLKLEPLTRPTAGHHPIAWRITPRG